MNENLVKEFADEGKGLSDSLRVMEREIEDIRNRYMDNLKTKLDKVLQLKEELIAEIEVNSNEFKEKKTRTLFGIKFGMMKQKGKIEIPNETKTIELIRKHFPAESDILVATKESIVKKALSNLLASDIKKIGVTVTADIDQPYIGFVDDDIKKYMDNLINKVGKVEV